MMYGKRKLYGILFWGWMILLTAGCGRRWEESELETGIRSEIAKVLPQGEIIDEMKITEKEKIRDAIRYYVYCQTEYGEEEAVHEKCYLVTYRRRNGQWICEEGTGVQLMEEKVAEPR